MAKEAELKINPQDVAKLAEMARLQVRADKLEALTTRYASFLNELERLRELDINDQEPVLVFRPEEG